MVEVGPVGPSPGNFSAYLWPSGIDQLDFFHLASSKVKYTGANVYLATSDIKYTNSNSSELCYKCQHQRFNNARSDVKCEFLSIIVHLSGCIYDRARTLNDAF